MTAIQPSAVTPPDAAVESCDVCIVEPGLAGINALFAASRYMSRDQKIILVDSRERVGGMWVDTYPYVRLHQPHGMFTAGNINGLSGGIVRTSRRRTRCSTTSDTASGSSRERVRVDELFGWTMESHDEIAGLCRSPADHPMAGAA